MHRASALSRYWLTNPYGLPILAFLMIFGLTTAGAQTNTFPASGNVGVGTTQPQATLDVDGSLVIEGSGIFSETSNGLELWEGDSPSYKIGFDNLGGSVGYIRQNIVAGGTNTWGHVFSTSQWGSPNTFTNTLFVGASGNVGIGTVNPTATLEVNGNILFTQPPTGGTPSGASMKFSDGTVQSTAWNGTTLGGDYAESVDVSGAREQYEPGDIIVIDNAVTGKFNKSDKPYSKLVAGVYSTKPGLIGRRTTAERPDKEVEVPMAMIGIVPTKVSAENGPIERGDLLVSASMVGYAMKGTDNTRMLGAVIGKALGPLKAGSGLIEVLVSLQ